MSSRKHKYVYGPVKSWRTGTSLGIDTVGEISTCSFNCSYCQLGKIQKVTQEIKTYVPSEFIFEDMQAMLDAGNFKVEDLDVITFAGSGEPTLAANLDELILGLKKYKVPISVLTNATLFNDPDVRKRISHADMVSVKLDAPNDEVLASINQPAEGISIETIVSGIKELKKEYKGNLQLQMMFMPKFIKDPSYIEGLASIINELEILKIQINTPTRPKPVGKEFHIETRGNHYQGAENDFDTIELPVISKEDAFAVEERIRDLTHSKLGELEILNVYKKG